MALWKFILGSCSLFWTQSIKTFFKNLKKVRNLQFNKPSTSLLVSLVSFSSSIIARRTKSISSVYLLTGFTASNLTLHLFFYFNFTTMACNFLVCPSTVFNERRRCVKGPNCSEKHQSEVSNIFSCFKITSTKLSASFSFISIKIRKTQQLVLLFLKINFHVLPYFSHLLSVCLIRSWVNIKP